MGQQSQQQPISKEKFDELTGKNKDKKAKTSAQGKHWFISMLSHLKYICFTFWWEVLVEIKNLVFAKKEMPKNEKVNIVEKPDIEKAIKTPRTGFDQDKKISLAEEELEPISFTEANDFENSNCPHPHEFEHEKTLEPSEKKVEHFNII